jgi:signal transduction histidine kinase/CheY-like chemotaxis protein
MRLVLFTTAIAVSVAGIAMLAYDLTVYRNSWVTELSNQASILAVSVAPALEFDDMEVAQRNLEAMRVRSHVLVAALYAADGHLYASYSRTANGMPPAKAPLLGTNIIGERVELSQPVARDGERVGTIYLLARYDVFTRLAAYASIFALIMVLSLGVTFVLSRRLQKAITEPLDAMTTVARQVVDRRDYSLRAQNTSDDEIGLVVRAFNGMLDEVEARARASEASHAALMISEASLREADRKKDEFLATLAHELRNPLAPIRNAVKLIEAEEATLQQVQWARLIIARQTQRMALLLDDLLDVSRITRGRLTLKMAQVDLHTVIEAAIEVARPLIEAKNQVLSVELPPQSLTLSCDALRLSQALSNLLTNAGKYTDAGGRITLYVRATALELMFGVIDTGIGLDPKVISGIFEMFSQLDAAIDRAEGGLGIGLALVKGLVGLHGGRVEARSPGVGLGSEFTLHLPLSTIVVPSDASRPIVSEGDEIAAPRCKVLIADDNRDAADSMAAVLKLSGYDVWVAHTGKEALELAHHHQPSAILLDIGMPDMTGYEVAREIRKQSWGGGAYLLALTGWGQTEDKERARAAGFNEHLTKPADLNTVERLLGEFLSGRTFVTLQSRA